MYYDFFLIYIVSDYTDMSPTDVLLDGFGTYLAAATEECYHHVLLVPYELHFNQRHTVDLNMQDFRWMNFGSIIAIQGAILKIHCLAECVNGVLHHF